MKKSTITTFALVGAFVFSGSISLFNAWINYSQVQKGKYKEITEYGLYSTDIQSYADRLSSFIDFEPTFNGEKVHNVVSFNYVLENTGNLNITPSDFHKPLTLTFSDDWRILHLENRWGDNGDRPSPLWIRTSPNSYQASPFLLNVNDSVHLTIYADTQNSEYADLVKEYSQEPSEFLKLGVRILGMQRVLKRSEYERRNGSSYDGFFQSKILKDDWPNLGTIIWGRALVAFFLLAPLFFYIYLKLIRFSKIVYFRQEKKFNLTYITSFLLSIVGAESLANLLFPNFINQIERSFTDSLTDNYLNFSSLAISITPMIFLAIYIYDKKPEKQRRKN